MKKVKKFQKIIGMSLSLAMLFTFNSAYSVSADNMEGHIKYNSPIKTNENRENQTVYYYSFEGIVREARSYYNQSGEAVEGLMYVLVENDEGHTVNFFVNDRTYMITDSEISVGAKVKGFYDANLPVIMIYPPQYHAVALAVDLPEVQNVKVDKFDENLLSSDKMLKLNVSKDTEVIFQDGTKFDGEISELGDRRLLVVYAIATASLPAQTPPLKVVILNETQMPDNRVELNGDIIVNGTKIDAPEPYIDDNGVIMVPVRAIAEALGYEVSWDGEAQSVLIGMGISMTLGKDYYIYMRTAPIELGTAPVLVDGYTYVPIEFFGSVMRVGMTDITEGQIVIDSLEENEDENGGDTIIFGG